MLEPRSLYIPILAALLAVLVVGCNRKEAVSAGPVGEPSASEPSASEPGADPSEGGGGMMGGDCPMMGEDGCPMMDGDGGMMEGADGEEMPEWMMSGDMPMGGDMMRDMRVIHALLVGHAKIERTVEDIPGGVRTTTTSEDPEIAETIRTHVRQMKSRLEQGQPIRMMDPVFREIFEHHEAIEMTIEDIPGGVRVTETSDNPKVTALIRQHAHEAVSEFVEQGMPRAMQPTPLPEGYEDTTTH